MEKINLVRAIKQLEKQKAEIEIKYKKEIEALEIAIEKCREINMVCEKCEGAGGNTYRIVAEADPEWHECTACKGIGYKG